VTDAGHRRSPSHRDAAAGLTARRPRRPAAHQQSATIMMAPPPTRSYPRRRRAAAAAARPAGRRRGARHERPGSRPEMRLGMEQDCGRRAFLQLEVLALKRARYAGAPGSVSRFVTRCIEDRVSSTISAPSNRCLHISSMPHHPSLPIHSILW